ncbi:MAG TPA: SpoIIE family protein phosphatase [Terrimicrobiaceae bacterium]
MKALIKFLVLAISRLFAKGPLPDQTIVGIFDNARYLDKAVERLARAGFEHSVYNEAILGEQAINVGPPVFASGLAPAVVWDSAEPALPSKPDADTIVRAFKAKLAHCRLPNEVIEAYATTFSHNGEFVLANTDAERAEQVVEILRECGARQVDRHDSSAPKDYDANAIFDFLLENTPDQVYFKDRRGRFIRASRAVAELLGAASEKDIIGKSDFDFWSMETAREAAADEQKVMKTRQPLVGKIERLVHPDGRISWDYTTKLPLLDASREVIGICGINKDFTAVKNVQDALAEERDRLKATTGELESKNALFEADLQLAREIQEALLPRDYPIFPGSGISRQSLLSFAHCYRPAEAIGGDFFDIFSLSQARAGIFICDVTGHGLRGALVTSILRTLLEELRPLMDDAGSFLGALNRRLRAVLERVEQPISATAFYMIADTAAKEVSFANAGHPDPLRLRRQAGIVEPLSEGQERTGPALGLFDSATYPVSRSSFDDADCIALFTNGLYKVHSPQGNEFGRSALVSTFLRYKDLHAEELCSAVLKELSGFAGRSDFDDDVCIVTVERAGE